MRKTRTRKEPSFTSAVADEPEAPIALLKSRKDLVAALVLLAAACGIASNALFLQKGPHPYPIFRAQPKPAASLPNPVPAPAPTPVVQNADPANPVALPRPRPVELASPVMPAPPVPPLPVGRSQTDIVIDIQKELSKRGFYEGVADGVYGAKTDTAIRDFEQTAGLKPTREPNEAFLSVVTQSKVKAQPSPKADAVRPGDEIANLIAPSKRVMAVQRALSEYGFGQLKSTGLLDRETQDAIGQFERSRKFPVSGQISPRLIRELAALTGRPLE